MQLDFVAREVTIKLVYYGPALSGKTTNLMSLHGLAGSESRGRLMTLETKDDRTLFFDLLPLTFRSEGVDARLRIKLFTVPGQPIHAATRKLVLQGADGVALIADSQIAQTENNGESFLDLRENLRANGSDIARVPLVIQFNKRDLPADIIRSDADIEKMAKRGQEPVFKASARDSVGVLETFLALLHQSWLTLDAVHGLGNRLRLDGGALLESAAKQLGATESAAKLLERKVGGEFRAIPIDPVSARAGMTPTQGGGRVS